MRRAPEKKQKRVQPRAGPASLSVYALALLVLVAAGLPAALGCSPATAPGPPLVVLDALPSSGALVVGSPVTLLFNLPVDAQVLRGRLKITPACQYELSVAGPMVTIEISKPVLGRTYTVSVAAGARGTSGATLQQDYTRMFTVLPAVAQGDSPGGPGSGANAGPAPTGPDSSVSHTSLNIMGAVLSLEDSRVFACDRSGFYSAPRFDSVRLYLGGSGRLDPGTLPAVLEVRPDGGVRRMASRQIDGPGWVELALEEETRPGWVYEFCLVSGAGTGAQPPVTYSLYSWSIHGSPRIYVWSLDVSSGRTTPVGRLDLGMEVDELIGAPGGLLAAVGNPGGARWYGLQVVQALTQEILPAGPPVAIFTDGNHLARQVVFSGNSLLAVGPAGGIPARVGETKWGGFLPPQEPDAPGLGTTARLSGEIILDRSTETDLPVLMEIRVGSAGALLHARHLPGRFVSGPAISRDGSSLAFVTYDFADNSLVRVWGLRFTDAAGDTALDVEPFLRELARLVYPNDTVSDFGYGGGVSWRSDGSGLWWDVCLPDGTTEIWTVDAGGGARSLVAAGAALPLVSPDGRMLFCRGYNEGVILGVDGSQMRKVSGRITAAAWLPDSTAVLVSDGQGVQLVPLSGAMRRLVSFQASPGCFVSPTEYWFVSDRRF